MAARLHAIETFALALPGVSVQPHFHYGSWRVGGKPGKPGRIFVTLPPGGEVLHLFLSEAARERILTLHPECTEKLFWGEKVVGVRVRLNNATAADVKAWVKAAWAQSGGEKWLAQQATATAPASARVKPAGTGKGPTAGREPATRKPVQKRS